MPSVNDVGHITHLITGLCKLKLFNIQYFFQFGHYPKLTTLLDGSGDKNNISQIPFEHPK